MATESRSSWPAAAKRQRRSLDDALAWRAQLKNDGLVSQTLGFQGDEAYYRGDSKSARALYEQALEAAIRGKEPAESSLRR